MKREEKTKEKRRSKRSQNKQTAAEKQGNCKVEPGAEDLFAEPRPCASLPGERHDVAKRKQYRPSKMGI